MPGSTGRITRRREQWGELFETQAIAETRPGFERLVAEYEIGDSRMGAGFCKKGAT